LPGTSATLPIGSKSADDLVKLTIGRTCVASRSTNTASSGARRGGTTAFNSAPTARHLPFYSNLTSDGAHAECRASRRRAASSRVRQSDTLPPSFRNSHARAASSLAAMGGWGKQISQAVRAALRQVLRPRAVMAVRRRYSSSSPVRNGPHDAQPRDNAFATGNASETAPPVSISSSPATSCISTQPVNRRQGPDPPYRSRA
jgi:hypothetical protein